MDSETGVEKAPLFAALSTAQFIQVVAIGIMVGAFSWIFTEVLGMYILKPATCSADAFVCAASSQSAVVVGSLLGAIIGLLGLVKLQIFRPLLIVIAATLSLWGIVGELTALAWYWSLGATVLLSAVTYATFMWIVRIRIFWLVLLLVVALIVGLRLIITA